MNFSTVRTRALWRIRNTLLAHAPTVYWSAIPYIPRFRQRRFHAYCIGTNKSGTTSIGQLLTPHYRSAHEPHIGEFLNWVVRYDTSSTSHIDPVTYLKGRDRELDLEMESNHLLVHCLDELYGLFPGAAYIFTIRDCYTWLNSAINQQLHAQADSDLWDPLYEIRYAPGEEFPDEERKLAEHGLFPVRSYLRYWSWHNQTVLDIIPPDARLTLRTHEISDRLNDIADLLAIPPSTLNRRRSHANRRKKKNTHILDLVDADYLQGQVEQCGASLVKDFFPTVRHPLDVLS